MISASHLTRRFGPLTAVDDVSFELERGEVVGFLGPNGAGKTTTMRMLTGFLPATSGTITIAGYDVLRESLAARQHLGYLPEGVPLYREHRVEEMLAFQGRLHGLGRARSRRRAGEVLERVGMAERRRSLIGRLSKGQRQRVGLAVALLPDPEVLILDEPTSGLDPLQRIEVRALISEFAADRTVLLSSHILPEIEAVCPRVIILHRGAIVADGSRDELVGQLGTESFVGFEALVGDVAEASRLLATLGGVNEVIDRGPVGIHHGFEIQSDQDLREDVGALAAMRGWAVRRLDWHRPTLEELFARIALELEPEGSSPPAVATTGKSSGTTTAPLFELATLGVSDEPPPVPKNLAPSLNPFAPAPPGSDAGTENACADEPDEEREGGA